MKTERQIVRSCLASTNWLWFTVVLMTALADVFFYQQPYGWPCGVFMLLVGVLLFARPMPSSFIPAMKLAFLILLVSAGAVVYRGGVLAPFLAFLSLIAMAAVRAKADSKHAGTWAHAALLVPFRMLGVLLRDGRMLQRRRSTSHRAGVVIGRTIFAWSMPLILGLLFLGLFCLANPVIEQGVDQVLGAVTDYLFWLKLPEFTRVLFWLIVATGLWGFWRIRSRRATRQVIPATVPPLALPCEGRLPLALRCLALFNVLFAMESVTDIIYLWGQCALPAGMTYAVYAHRGAYTLVVTALLSAGLTIFFFQPGRLAERHTVARVLVFIWLAQNVLLMVSAAWRLHLYVDVYSLTCLRLASFVWMCLVGVGLLTIGWRIALKFDNYWLLDVNVMALLAVLLGCAWWPMNGFVAHHNVHYCREAGGPGQALDLDYLRNLGPEAIPALQTYAQLNSSRKEAAVNMAAQLNNELLQDLQNPRAWTVRLGMLAQLNAK